MLHSLKYLGGLLALTGLGGADLESPGFGTLIAGHVVSDTADLDSTLIPATLSASTTTCTHGPNTRACWSDGYSVATDFDKRWPSTGKTIFYDWTLQNATCDLDGRGVRECLLLNGQYPGPTLKAEWGDMISVTVHNRLANNGTSIHWHGIRQLHTNGMDGTNGLTECPIAPGHSASYKFQATQFGTSWYHSHYSTQYGDGVVGPIVIDGPATANYDVDLGPMPVSDWYYTEAFTEDQQQNLSLQANPPQKGADPDTVLINGTNGLDGGLYNIVTLTPNKVHRLRLINTGLDNALRVSIDNHQMLVITSDFVPIVPIDAVDSVMLGVGQRYDVLINATQHYGNFWMRVVAERACNSTNNGKGQAIVRYEGGTDSTPTSPDTAMGGSCDAPGTLTPYVSNTVGSEDAFKSQARSLDINLGKSGIAPQNQNIVVWGVNVTAIDVQWQNPTLEYVLTDNTSYPTTENLIELSCPEIWVYWIIQEVESGPVSIYHPMHLHGHDFYELGSGLGTFDISKNLDSLQFNNPPRRDTTMLPAGGWLVLAFQTDNPGAWLFHCHIAWHISQGLGVQFLESKQNIAIPEQFADQCSAWKDFERTALYLPEGSGL
ncbi:MAG: hypothetical protein Q9159_006641 [Coniocarpon cinnabarinum]